MLTTLEVEELANGMPERFRGSGHVGSVEDYDAVRCSDCAEAISMK